MSSIDFKGDGETGEYGRGYISLAPVPATPQPFRFNTYDGMFRWYSFAIHGTNDPSTLGKRVSNGCARLVNDQMAELYDRVPMNTRVVLYEPLV